MNKRVIVSVISLFLFAFAIGFLNISTTNKNNPQMAIGAVKAFAMGDGGGDAGGAGDGGGDAGGAGDGGGCTYNCNPVNYCTNGATNYPYCNNNHCTNGATNYPSCNNVCTNGYSNYPTCGPTTCTNGATNYPSCNNVCTNGYSNYPTCGPTTCSNGATNYPYCNNNFCTNGATNFPTCNNVCTNGYSNYPTCAPLTCSNGATNYPYCNNNVCTNGASNYPSCNNVCTNGYSNYPTCGPTTCSNGATNYPYCNNNICSNGATNYPYCNNNVCTNGASNYPSCNNICTNGYSNYPTCGPTTCSNGATNYPYCNNNNVCTNGYSNYPTCGPITCPTGYYLLNGSCTYNYSYNYNYNYNYNVCTNGATNYPYCNNNYVPPAPRPVPPPTPIYTNYNISTVVTRAATAVGYTTAQLNGTYITSYTSNQTCQAFFEYGTNYSLGSRTNTQSLYNNTTANYFSQGVYGLSPNTTYYYRADVTCYGNTKYGSIVSFRTPGYIRNKVVYYPKPKTEVKKTPQCLCTNDYMSLDIQLQEQTLVPGQLAHYVVSFKNTSKEILNNVAIRIDLPTGLTINSVDRGDFNQGSNTYLITIPAIPANADGSFIITINVTNDVATSPQVIVNGYSDFTIATILKSGIPAKGEATSYIISPVDASLQAQTSNDNSNQSFADWFKKWVPENVFEWFVAILVFLVFFAALRYVLKAYREIGR